MSNKIQHVPDYLKELIAEATELFEFFDYTSQSIVEFENVMNNAKAYFPFRMKIKENPEGQIWSLSWERLDQEGKKNRLLLIHECRDDQHKLKELSKKPLMETRVEVRIEFTPFIKTFILGFQEYLQAQKQKMADGGDFNEMILEIRRQKNISPEKEKEFVDDYPDFLRE